MKSTLSTYMDEIIYLYYDNNAKRLHNLVNQIFCRKYGGTSERDMDEFYSVANDVFADIIRNKRYNPEKGDFEGFLYGSLSMAIVDELKKQNRDKRMSKTDQIDENGEKILDKNGRPKRISVPNLYMDAPIDNDECMTFGDTIPSDFSIEDDVLKVESEKEYSPEMEKYLSKLSKTQVKILELLADEYTQKDIIEILQIDKVIYKDSIIAIKSYKNTRYIARLIRRKSNVR